MPLGSFVIPFPSYSLSHLPVKAIERQLESLFRTNTQSFQCATFVIEFPYEFKGARFPPYIFPSPDNTESFVASFTEIGIVFSRQECFNLWRPIPTVSNPGITNPPFTITMKEWAWR